MAPLGVPDVERVTTNDNLAALRFYQRSGFRLVELRAGALDEARHLKPSIPATGSDGIRFVTRSTLCSTSVGRSRAPRLRPRYQRPVSASLRQLSE